MAGTTVDHGRKHAPRSAGRAGQEAARINPGTRATDSTVANRARQEGMRRVGPRKDKQAGTAGKDRG